MRVDRMNETRKRSMRAFKGCATYDVENVECCQRIFGARKTAAHLRLRPFLDVLVEALQPRSTRVAGDLQRETLRSSRRRALHEETTVLRSITIHKTSHFTVLIPQRNPHDGRQLATARSPNQRDGDDRCAR